MPGYLEWQALVLRNGAIISAVGEMSRTRPARESSRNLGMHGVAEKCKKHAEGERKRIKNGARCGMGVWDGNKSRVQRLERQGLACQWTIREGI